MLIVAVAWLFVIAMVALAELASPQGGVLRALGTVVFYGVLPLGLVLWLMGASSRRRRLRATGTASSAAEPDRGGHPSGGAVAAEREEA